MKQAKPLRKPGRLRGLSFFLAGAFVLMGSGRVAAQTSGLSAEESPAKVPALRLGLSSLAAIAARLSRESGVRVVADRTVASQRVRLETVGGPLERVLEQVIAQLPAGTALRKVLLPPTLPGANVEGDLVAALVQAQDALLRPISGPATPGPADVVLLGRIVPAAQAAGVGAALDLHPLYLLTNPRAANDPLGRAHQLQAENLKLWMSLTPQQQQALAEQQFDSLFNMDPSLRRAMMQQMMQLSLGIMQKMQQLSPEQRQSFLDDIRNALPPGSVPGGGPR